jgi:hypothetical protein
MTERAELALNNNHSLTLSRPFGIALGMMGFPSFQIENNNFNKDSNQ